MHSAALLPAVLLLHAAATFYMVGVIWMVQLAHYPLLGAVGPAALPAYQAANLRRTSWVVGPPMVVEAGLAVGLAIWAPPVLPLPLLGTAGALLALVWGSTAVWQVPAHQRLSVAADPVAVRRLVWTNWVRTVAWTARGGLALAMIYLAGDWTGVG